MNESEYTTCPYCGESMPLTCAPNGGGRLRKQCGKLECKRAFNAERARKWNAQYMKEHGTCCSWDRYQDRQQAHNRAYAKNRYDTAEKKAAHTHSNAVRLYGTSARRHRAETKLIAAARGLQGSKRARLPFYAGWCSECGQPFVARGNRALSTCCSFKCSRRAIDAARHAAKRGAVTQVRYRRVDIFERDGWRCHICGKKIRCSLPHSHPLGATLDHLIPLADGGADAPDNVAAAHRLCNSIKGVSGPAQLLLGV